MMGTTRILAVAAICLAAVSAPAHPQENQQKEIWSETLKKTAFDWWERWRREARKLLADPVTLNMCWASDKNALVADPAFVAGFQDIPGNEKVTVKFERDNAAILLGSGDIMNRWDGGHLICSTVSPDASILGLRAARWKRDEQTMYASTMVVGVINPQAAELLGKFYKKDPRALTFRDLVSVAGRRWAEIAPGDTQAANWGTVKGHASDCARSASCQVAAVALAFSASGGPGKKTGREIFLPKVKAVIDPFMNKIDHSEGSTSRLTQKCLLNPVVCDFFFTYESQIPEIEKQIPGAITVYNDLAIQADQVVMVTASDKNERAAAIRFIEYIMSAPIQRLIAEKYNFRPAIDLDVQGPVRELTKLRLPILHNPDSSLVKAVLAGVAPAPPDH
jgi:Bacterial extracellular solute-binding protein